MSCDYDIPWNRSVCRRTVDRLKDGLPPVPETVEFLTVGYDACLERTKRAFSRSLSGLYDVVLLEGRYGIGKSHMLTRIGEMGLSEGFKVKRVQVGDGRVYFNHPDSIYRLLLGDDRAPSYYYYWRGDPVRKFIGQVKALAETYVKQGHRGLIILLDELENTLFSVHNFRSRAKAYRFLGALFRGHDGSDHGHYLELNNVFVAMAITPGAIEWARSDGGWCLTENPAEDWRLPDRLSIEPLTIDEAFELGTRIRAIHSRAFDWVASQGVGDDELLTICKQWIDLGTARDERQVVKLIVHALELAEQDR